VTYPASIAAIAFVLARYLGELLPHAPAPAALAAGAIVASALANAIGLRTGARTQVVLTAAKVVPLLVLTAAALGAGTWTRSEPAPGTAVSPSLATLLAAVLVVLWTYDGWSDVTLVAGEVESPRRNLPRTALLGIGIVVVLYLTVQGAVSLLLPREAAMSSGGVVAQAVAAGLGPRAGTLVAALVVVATFGSIHGVVLTASRLGYAMARDGVFFRWFGAVHPHLGTPARSIAALAAASLAYLFLFDFEGLLSYFSFAVWIFYALAAIAVLRLRRKGIGGDESFPLGAIAPWVVLAAALVVTSSVATSAGSRAAIGAAMLVAGFPVYVLWRRLSGRRQA
jgi:APA family basic amino acid/polyamine antiporter